MCSGSHVGHASVCVCGKECEKEREIVHRRCWTSLFFIWSRPMYTVDIPPNLVGTLAQASTTRPPARLTETFHPAFLPLCCSLLISLSFFLSTSFAYCRMNFSTNNYTQDAASSTSITALCSYAATRATEFGHRYRKGFSDRRNSEYCRCPPSPGAESSFLHRSAWSLFMALSVVLIYSPHYRTGLQTVCAQCYIKHQWGFFFPPHYLLISMQICHNYQQ